MSVLPEILEWSTTRPKWQQDALRRIVQETDIDDSQVEELTRLCLMEFNSELSDGTLKYVPLSHEHIAGLIATKETVILRGLGDLKNVNALASDQRLCFAEKGITVIYGDNGAGKSGYGRVLKHVCRCRSKKPPIHSNVYEPAPGAPSSASIEYNTDGNPQTHGWVAGAIPPPHLAQVSFFDSECASHYVETKSHIAYRPFGLDILPKLVGVCDRVRGALQQRINELTAKKSFVGFTDSTSAGKFVKGLNGKTTHEDLEAACACYNNTATRVTELRGLISTADTRTAKTRATDLRLKARRFRALVDKFDALSLSLSDNQFVALREAKLDYETKKTAADASASFEPQILSGIGSQSWLVLWEAAKRYSTEVAYPNRVFPVTEGNSVCVLCQQPLQSDGARRLEQLEKYVQREAQAKAGEAAKQFEISRERFEKILVPDFEALDQLAEIRELDKSLEAEVSQFLQIAKGRQTTARDNCAHGEWIEPAEFVVSPGKKLLGMAEKLEAEATQVESTLQPEVEAGLRSELAELTEHELLLLFKSEILLEITRSIQKEFYELVHAQTNTYLITKKNGEMIRRVLTNDLKGKFEAELKALALNHLSVDVVDQGNQKGELYYQVELRGKKNQSARALDVLSEGEHRCIALAAFLAEVSTQSNESTIVFDDPVTSLDHGRRETVARRLVKEAAKRPVIVMTHDIVFLFNLHEAAEASGTNFTSSFLESRGGKRGIPVEGLPWRGLPVAKRVKWLRNELVGLEKCLKEKSQEDYERQAAFLWGRLRESWEAGVEEVLLNGAVVRFNRAVSTVRLEKIPDITYEDIKAVEKGMTDSSTWLPGHTQALEINAPMPGPEVLKQAVEDLENWRASITKRREKK